MNDSNEENPASKTAERRRVGFGAAAFFMRRQKKHLTPVFKPFYFDVEFCFETARREDAIYERQVFLGRESIQAAG
jgi:hypothetical protein